MPKPPLVPELEQLESNIIDTLIAGLKQWRPDLKYPESYSDWQACVRGLLVMFDVQRRPLPKPLASPCPDCKGVGYFIRMEQGCQHQTGCSRCSRTGKVYY